MNVQRVFPVAVSIATNSCASGRVTYATPPETVQAAMDLYMAQNSLTAVTASGVVSPFSGGVSDFSASNPVLYPDFLRQDTTKCDYVWVVSGQVTQDPSC